MKKHWVKQLTFAGLLVLATHGIGVAAEVGVQDGNVVLKDRGVETRLTSDGKNYDPALSVDGQWVVYVHTRHESTSNIPTVSDDGRTELWLVQADGKNLDNKSPRMLLAPAKDDVDDGNMNRFFSPQFSPDGRSVYFLTPAWATSNAVERINIETGKVQEICDGNELQVIPSGRYAGHLIVQKHKYRNNGNGSYDDYWLVSPEGKELKRIGGTEKQVKRFLQAQRKR